MRKIEKVVEINELLRIYGALLTKRQFNVLSRRYGSDWSLGEIAEADKITRQAVLNFENKAIRTLYKLEKKLGVWAREKSIKDLLKKAIADENARSALADIFIQ